MLPLIYNLRYLVPLRPVNTSLTISWLNNDSWSEAYVGTRRLIYEVLPPSIAPQTAEAAALCQLAVIGANHLMEIALAKLLHPVTTKRASFTKRQNEEASYWLAISQWVRLRQFSLRIHSRKAAGEIPIPGSGQSPLGTHDPLLLFDTRVLR